MVVYCYPFFSEFEKEFESLKAKNINIINKCHEIITFLEQKLQDLFTWLKKYKFDNIEDEVNFFKILKPSIVSKLIYYKEILSIETNLPASKKNKIKLYKKALNKVYKHSKNNKNFFEYFRARASHKDQLYFVRSKNRNVRHGDCSYINYDSKLSTSHDYLMATMIAYDTFTNYLENRIEEIEKNCSITNPSNNTSLNWSVSKVDLVELIYSLHHTKAFNNGNSDIKEIAAYFSKMFNVEIEDSIYRSYLDIKSRKTDRAKFLKQLSDTLNHKINEEEN